MKSDIEKLDDLLLNPMDYDYGFHAIRDLLSRLEHDAREFAAATNRIGDIAAESSGLANELATEEWVENLHYSCYLDAAHSMAAVGMIAPFLESLLRAEFRRVERKWPDEDFVTDVVKYASSVGLIDHMPTDFEKTLRALYVYRNRMFHLGFEWPPKKREKFKKKRSNSPVGQANGSPKRLVVIVRGCFTCRRGSLSTVLPASNKSRMGLLFGGFNRVRRTGNNMPTPIARSVNLKHFVDRLSKDENNNSVVPTPNASGQSLKNMTSPDEKSKPEPAPVESRDDRVPFGRWLVENMPRGTNLEIPDRQESDRPIPFLDEDDS